MTHSQIKKLNAMIGKKYEYMAETYTFKGWEEVNLTLIISTDSRHITMALHQIDMFLSGIIEISDGEIVPARPTVSLESIDRSMVKSLSEKMNAMLDEISEAKSAEQIRNVKAKATAMSNVVNSMTGVAKLELDILKENRRKF